MSFMSFFTSQKSKSSKYHNYPASSTEDQKKLDSLIKFKNTNGLQQLSIHNVKLTQRQVYDVMLGDAENSFIYHFNTDLMVYFLNNHKTEIYKVLMNMLKDIAEGISNAGFVEYKSGFVVSTNGAEDYYGEWLLLGNFLQNPGFQSIIAEDTAFAVEICDNINTFILTIRDMVQNLFEENRKIQSSMSGILEQVYVYNEQILSVTIREIYENAQQKDINYLINGLIGGTQTAQKSKIIERISEQVKQFDLSELPPEALAHYEEIKIFITDLEAHREKMPEDMKLLYERLVDIRLTEVMEQYIVLPKKFLELYKNQEDSPQKLITKSLESMENALMEIHKAYFNKKVLDLHATKIYMEEMAKSSY